MQLINDFSDSSYANPNTNSVLASNHCVQSSIGIQSEINRSKARIYEEPINIDDDSDFGPTGYNFPGNGTKKNPYIVDGLNITISSGIAIYIRSTSVYFIIRNNHLDGLTNASIGIQFQGVQHGVIETNYVKDFHSNLINIAQSSNNNISYNIFEDNIQDWYHTSGIWFVGSSNNRVISNNISNTHFASAISVSAGSNLNLFRDNVIVNKPSNTFSIIDSNDNTLYNNSLYDIKLTNSDNNTVYGNSIYNGLNVYSNSDRNQIQINNFMNDCSASDEGSNNTFAYNYWSVWIGYQDINPSDGIIDVPFPISGTASSKDLYPIAVMIHSFLTPPIIIFPRTGDQVSGTVKIEWFRSLNFINHEVTYSLSYSNNTGRTWILLSSYQTSLFFQWNTTRVPNGDYQIKIIANCSEGTTSTIITNGYFSVKNHFLIPITVLNPQDRDVLNNTININWIGGEDTLEHQVSYSIFLSTNSGLNWTLIRMGYKSTTLSFDTAPYKNVTGCIIKVQAMCIEGLMVSGFSKGTFSILNIRNPTTISGFIQLIYLLIFILYLGIVLVLGTRLGRGILYQVRYSHARAGVCLGSFTDNGFVIQWKSENCPFNEQTLRYMIEYTAMMYQKGDYGNLFGPFPQTVSVRSKPTEWLFISYGLQTKDETVEDLRIVKGGGIVPAILLVFYPKPFDPKFQNKKNEFLDFTKIRFSKEKELEEIVSQVMAGIENYIFELFYIR